MAEIGAALRHGEAVRHVLDGEACHADEAQSWLFGRKGEGPGGDFPNRLGRLPVGEGANVQTPPARLDPIRAVGLRQIRVLRDLFQPASILKDQALG